MKTTLLTLLAVITAVALWLGLSAFAEAQGTDGGGTVSLDAGTAPAPAATPAAPIATPDPVAHPAAAYDFWKDARKKGTPYAVVLALYMIAAAISSRAKAGSWWDKGRLPTIAAAVAASSMAVLLAMTHVTDWPTAMGAILAAGATILHSDPPKVPAKLPLPGGG